MRVGTAVEWSASGRLTAPGASLPATRAGAMAGLGMGVRLAAIRSVGPRVLCAVVLSLATLIGLTLVLLRLFGIDGGPSIALAG